MDIQRWLDETVLPEQPPSPPDQRCEAHSLHPKGREPPPREKRRRKASTSDSSLLDALPQHTKAPLIIRENAVEESADESARSDASHPASRSGSSTSSQPYARKPRRKTRPERYEPTSKDVKEQGTYTRHWKDESKKTKHKSRRKKVEKPGSGVVQSFVAKNVPRDRLTLKPREKLGLFNKGRASSPVKGRGLPDLVFSEMKFLQKHKDQPEVDPTHGVTKKKRKKDHAHAKEEEISAYFTSVRPAIAEKDVNIQAKGASYQKKLQDVDCREKQPSPVIDNAIPTVEVADKASYLGFESREPHHGSGSYVSWSESIQAPSATPARPRIRSINSGQLDSVHHGGRDGGTADGGEVLHSRLAPLAATRHITDGSGERFQVSSLAPANDLLSRSHSLPQHTSSPRRVNLVDRAAKHRALESVASPSSMPPFIPGRSDPQGQPRRPTQIAGAATLRGTHSSDSNPDAVPAGYTNPNPDTGQAMADEVDPQTSSSLGRILQECNAAFHERRQAAGSYGRNNPEAEPSDIPDQGEADTHRGCYPTIQRISTGRFSGVDEIYRPRIPNFSGPSIYERQEQRQYFDQQANIDDDDALEPLMWVDGEVYGEDAGYWDAVIEPASYDAAIEASPDELVVPEEVEIGQDSTRLRSNIVTSAGFWRPHKLY